VLPSGNPEIAGFIQNGAGPGRFTASDTAGPFNSYPHDPNSRTAYLVRLWRAFHRIQQILGLAGTKMDLVLIDMPTVPTALALANQNRQTAEYRPVELAFGNKVLIPGAAVARLDGRIQFSRFQPAIINGCRPAYAVFEMAQQVFQAATVVESFPQLILGALSEYAVACNLPLISRLADHKTGNQAARQAAQTIVEQQITSYFGGVAPTWLPHIPTVAARSDGYDALLGLIPGVVYFGFRTAVNPQATWSRCVTLRNLTTQFPPNPQAQGPGNAAAGCRAWINPFPQLCLGVDDSGIMCLDLALWR
jgi:hypothetical protein